MKKNVSFLIRPLGVLALALSLITVGSAQTVDPRLYSGLVWRNIGPFRGGRVSAVTGALGQPGVFYMGLPLGGIWKTTSAGQTWYPVFDSIKDVSCIGSIQVAPSDPNTIYAGTGDIITGGGINEGNGVYKSTDAGKTWQHMGLDDTKQIPALLVDPHNPNIVLIAAQGNPHTHTDQRGVFRSTDGGLNWTKTLYVDNETGAQNIAWAYDHPDVMFATTVRHYSAPGTIPVRGGAGAAATNTPPPKGTALYKSTDEGVTWTEVTGGGLPSMTGRTCVAVAMNTNSQRVFLIGTFGLYRSDDGGTTWRKMATSDRRIANGQGNYTSGVYVDSKNPDIVYTLATCSYKSTDGGVTFTGFKGAPGGDDPQQMWIDPTDGNRIFLGGDQGAVISLDAGTTWGSWYNQATAQVYHISVDNQFPYWVYATQQDSGSVATSSRGNLGEITPMDWLPHPGYEFGSIVADPLNPKISYAGGPGGGIVKVTYPSGQWINVSPSVGPTEPLRRVGNQPIAFSPVNPHELLAGFQYLMSTIDGGLHWKKLSPDLGEGKQVPEAPAAPTTGFDTGGRRSGPRGGSIESFSISTVAPGTIWVATNNGLIKVTKDHGATWDDVTIPNLPSPTRSDISMIDASHQDAGTAYVAVDLHNMADYKPYLYRTHDFGKTWTQIVNGLPTDQPSGSFARAIRADTKREGLLFAGTESSMYVSFNDGNSWQSLMLNLPNTSYRDIAIHENDLVVGTYGRSFWVLDDYSPLRELTSAIASQAAHLFKPEDAIRVRRNVNGDTPFPPEVPHALNPPLGAVIYYSLGAKPSGPLTLEISDSSGKVIRHMSSAAIPPSTDPLAPVPDFWLEQPKPMPAELGLNRVSWNIRHDGTPAFSRDVSSVMGANPGQTPFSPEGPLALPGTYTAKLTVDGKSYSQTFTVKNDPRSPARAPELQDQHNLLMNLYDAAAEAADGYHQVSAMRALVAEISKANPDVAAAVTDFDAKLSAAGGVVTGRRGFGGGGGFGGPPSFTSVNAAFVRQLETLDFGDMEPNDPQTMAFATAYVQLKTAIENWKTINSKDLSGFNAVLTKNGLKPISTAKGLPDPVGPPTKFVQKATEIAKAAAQAAAARQTAGNEEGGEDDRTEEEIESDGG